jgi:hypothetical protein
VIETGPFAPENWSCVWSVAEAPYLHPRLAATQAPEELNRVGLRVYGRFPADVPQGAEDRGAKGELRLERIARTRE